MKIKKAKAKKAEITLENTLTVILAALGLILLFAGAYKLYQIVVNQEQENAKNFLNVLEAKINALQDGETGQFSMRGVEGWFLTGWSKDDPNRPIDKIECFLDSCVCICKGTWGDLSGLDSNIFTAVVKGTSNLLGLLAGETIKSIDENIINNKKIFCQSSKGFCRALKKDYVSAIDNTIIFADDEYKKDTLEAIIFDKSILYELIVEKNKDFLTINHYMDSYYSKLSNYNKQIQEHILILPDTKFSKEEEKKLLDEAEERNKDNLIRELKINGYTDEQIFELFKEKEIEISKERIIDVSIINKNDYNKLLIELFGEYNVEVSKESIFENSISKKDSSALIAKMKEKLPSSEIIDLLLQYGIDLSKEGISKLNILGDSSENKKISEIFKKYGFDIADESVSKIKILKIQEVEDNKILNNLNNYGFDVSLKRITFRNIPQEKADELIKAIKDEGYSDKQIIDWFKAYNIDIPAESASKFGFSKRS